MIARAEGIKAQVLGDPEVRELASRTWDDHQDGPAHRRR